MSPMHDVSSNKIGPRIITHKSVARETNRGHTVAAVCNSFHLAKDCGFKVVTHMMPDLPNTGLDRDMEGFKE